MGVINTSRLVPWETVNLVSQGTLRFQEKINCFLRDQSLSDLLCNPRRKIFCVQIYENNSCERSTFAGNSALLPSDVIDFALLPAQRFWRETVSLLDVM